MVVVCSVRDGVTLPPLLALMADQNTAAMGLDPAQRDFLTGVTLTEEQWTNPELDILTGFVAADSAQRVIVVEGLRKGAMQKVAEVLQVGVARWAERRVLFSTGVGFARRLYGRLGLALKHVKLRQPELETLTVRPDLCLNNSSDEAAYALHCLAEMRRAERLHSLKDAFPPATAVLAVETQYGTYVSDEELAGLAGSKAGSVKSAARSTSKASKMTVTLAPSHETTPARSRAGRSTELPRAWLHSTRRDGMSTTMPSLLLPMGSKEPMYSFNVAEPYREDPGTSVYLNSYMKDIARPVVLPKMGQPLDAKASPLTRQSQSLVSATSWSGTSTAAPFSGAQRASAATTSRGTPLSARVTRHIAALPAGPQSARGR